MKEKWKDTVHDCVNYEVSNLGRIRNKNTGRILKPNLKRNGYLQVTLGYGKHKDVSIHRVVAMAFVDNDNNFPIINHIDEDKTNNIVDNLEWCNYSYNRNYGSCKDNFKRKVFQIHKETGIIINIWNGMADAEKSLGICYQGISACCRGIKKTAGGYRWEYYN